MALMLYSILRRNLKNTGRYFEPSQESEQPRPDGLDEDEVLLGWYRNPEPWENCVLVFTDRAIYSVEPAKSFRLMLNDIEGYETPDSKSQLIGVRIRTSDGFRFLRVAGSTGADGKFRDAFGLITVIQAVLRSRTSSS